MGYFKRPIRRGAARLARLTFVEAAREVRASDWRRCDGLIRSPANSFLRFVIEDPQVGRCGLFRSSELLEDAQDFPLAARSELRAVFRWFDANLPAPRRLPKDAVCWFRSDASKSLERLRALVEFYRLMDHPVWMQATRNPGRVVYRDAYQVAAVPYADRHTTLSAL
jgi:hypothetical protein